MQVDPVRTSLKHVSEAKRALELLIGSSEKFDYVQARRVLGDLEKRVAALDKLEKKLQKLAERRKVNIQVVDFTRAGAELNQSPADP